MNKILMFALFLLSVCKIVCAQPNFIALADYFDEYHRWERGSAIVMNDATGKWKFTNKIGNMSENNFFRLNTVNCKNQHCVIGGAYSSRSSTHEAPLLISSVDHGQSWKAIDHISGPDIKSPYLEGEINKIKCWETICVAIGMAFDKYSTNTQAYPVFISQDAGMSWSALKVKGYEKKEPLLDLACIDKKCIAMNQYGQYIVSKDGLRWENLTLPIEKLRIKSVDASEKNFILAAQQQTTPNGVTSMLLISKDNGKHFVSQDNIDLSNTFAEHISCYNNTCLLTGTTKGKNARPVAWVSKDGGETWASVLDKINFPSNMVSLILHKTICTSQTCAIMGTHHDGNNWFPLLITIDLNQDKLVMTNDAFKGAHFGGKLEFNDINCTESDCILSGGFNPKKDIKTYPAVLISDTKMKTWKAMQPQNYSQQLTSIKLHEIILHG